MFIIDKKEKFLIIIFIVIILSISLILYFRYGLKKIPLSTPFDNPLSLQNNIPFTPEDLEIFNDPIFQDLEIPKDSINNIGPVGRDNPFAPYE